MCLKDEFTARLVAAAREWHDLGNPRSIRFENMIHEHGGVETARRLVAASDIQDGLRRANAIVRLDLAVESIMLEPQFQALFTRQELAAATWRLQQL